MESIADAPGHPDRATFVIGQRGMGKTVLLLELAERSKEYDFIVVRVPCLNPLSVEDMRFLKAMATDNGESRVSDQGDKKGKEK